MKRLSLLLLVAAVLSACSSSKEVAQAPVKRKAVLEAEAAAKRKMIDGVPVQTVGFRPGVSSTTVERLAKAEQCTGGQGAGLVTEQGPVEVYRMACANGKVFMARCEFRQCTPMKQDVASR